MKRTIATLFATSSFAIAATAHADELQSRPEPLGAYDYDAAPAVLFVPTEPVDLVPATMCPVSTGGQSNSGLGCIAGLEEAGPSTPGADVADIVDGLTTALAPYNVRVTTTRPPEYVPYLMLLVNDTVSKTGTSYTCTGAPIGCDAKPRHEIASINGGTMNCDMPDRVQSALIAFGYISGLENTDDPTDVMYYRPASDTGGPDWTMPSTTFVDTCVNQVESIDGEDNTMTNNLLCGYVHESYCDMQDGQINPHQELLGVYGAGPFVEDTTPPTVDMMTIANDGDVLPAGSGIDFQAMVSDDSNLVFARWTIESPALAGLPGADENGRTCKGTNGVCAVEYSGGAAPYYDSSAGFGTGPEFAGALPGGDYTVTFEASDLSGNTIEPIVVHVTIEGDGGTGGADTSGGASASASASDTNASDSNGDSSSEGSGGGGSADSGQTDDSDGGCSCTTEPGAGGGAFALGLFGLAFARRRNRR